MVGSTLGHYEILEQLGSGGMGEVYRARDKKLEREVALKVLPAAFVEDESRLRRLRREAKAMAALDHPGIVTIFSVEEADGVTFLTMALVRGMTLGELIPPEGLALDRVLELGEALADALRAAHEHGIVHRDLKPSNVMVDDEGRLRVLDFGLSRIVAGAPVETAAPTETATAQGTWVGTVPYMSPEQAEGKPVGPGSDVFSLGIVLYEMVTGRRPFRGESTASLVSSILRDTPTPVSELRPHVPGSLAKLISRCLEKRLDRRPESAATVRDSLRAMRREPPASRLRARGARLALVVMTAGLAAVLAVVAYKSSGTSNRAPTAVRSLAVLPLDNLTGDLEQEYLADGMTQALIDELAGIGALKVISRTSIMRFKHSDLSLADIARELDVDAILEGSVQREDDIVRITAQLVDAVDERRIWGDAFERELEGALRMQSEVARSIASAIAVEVSADEARLFTDARDVDPATYETYLRGMHFLTKGTPEGLRRGMALLNEATDLDPTDPLAYAGLAEGYVLLGHATGDREQVRRAKAAARRALELDPANAEAQAALAQVAMYFDWDWDAARDAFRRAVRLKPNRAENHLHYAFFHLLFGDFDAASNEVLLARELDPLSPLATAGPAEFYVGFGLWERAEEAAVRALELDSDFARARTWLAQAYLGEGRIDDALREARRAAEGGPRWVPWLGTVLVAAGRREEARELLDELLATPDAGHTFLELACLQAALGDREGAMASLERATREREVFAPWIGSWADFGELADTPRFRALLDAMHLELVRPRLLAAAAASETD